jgi:glycosyltransferase involved in cell wall biosynthesis
MLCECIPIGSEVAAIPEIIGHYGFIVHHRDDAEIAETIMSALRHDNKIRLGKNARQHIIDTFGEGKRAAELARTLNQLFQEKDNNIA